MLAYFTNLLEILKLGPRVVSYGAFNKITENLNWEQLKLSFFQKFPNMLIPLLGVVFNTTVN